MRRAARVVAGARVLERSGYATLVVEAPAELTGLSPATADLLSVFPVAAGGRRLVQVDVRNRQWAALCVELLEAIGRCAPPGAEPRERGITPSQAEEATLRRSARDAR